jgi:hypothetical protein
MQDSEDGTPRHWRERFSEAEIAKADPTALRNCVNILASNADVQRARLIEHTKTLHEVICAGRLGQDQRSKMFNLIVKTVRDLKAALALSVMTDLENREAKLRDIQRGLTEFDQEGFRLIDFPDPASYPLP